MAKQGLNEQSDICSQFSLYHVWFVWLLCVERLGVMCLAWS